MNAARHRGDAISAIVNYGATIALHIALVVLFPENPAVNHWRAEVDAFAKTLRKFHKGKKGRKNFTHETLLDEFLPYVADPDEREIMLDVIEDKGLTVPDDANWQAVIEAIAAFADSVLAEGEK